MPAALKMGVVVATAAYLLKWAEVEGHITFPSQMVKSASLYSGFSFTLAFMLVFRTSQSYQRFWNAAVQLETMRSQWYEAANWLVKFVMVSKACPEKKRRLQHTFVRLFSMLGATAMGALCDMEDDEYGVLDIESFSHQDLDFLAGLHEEDHRPSVVYQWVQSLMLNSVNDGTLTVPPPLLTRVAQQMEQGMMSYRQVLLIKQTPFPFPYTQICWVLVIINMIATPFMMCSYTDEAWVSALFTLICIVCINTIHMIATEIENPLGDDINDLPCHEYHDAFNEHLALLLHPGTLTPPVLLPTAVTDADLLLDPRRPKGLSLGQYFNRRHAKGRQPNPSVVFEEKNDGAVVLNIGVELPSGDVSCATAAIGLDTPSMATEVNSSMMPSAGPLGIFLDDFSRKLLENQTELNSILIRQVETVEKFLCANPRSRDGRSNHDPVSSIDAQILMDLCRVRGGKSCADQSSTAAHRMALLSRETTQPATEGTLFSLPKSPKKGMRIVSPTKSFFNLPPSPKKFFMAHPQSPKKGGA